MRMINRLQELAYLSNKESIRRTKEIQSKIDEHIFCQLKYVTPPIKGEVTKGKMKYRGLKIIYREAGILQTEVWLEQRGVLVGDKLLINRKL